MKYLRLHHGYTLIELLLYVSMIGFLLTALTAFFASTSDARLKNQSISTVNQQGTAAMEYISQTIRNASSITSPAAGGTASSLTLVVPTGSLSPTIIDLSGTTLETKEGTAAYVPLTGGKVQVTNLTVKNLSRSGTDGTIEVSFTVTRVNTIGRNEFDYTKTFITTGTIR